MIKKRIMEEDHEHEERKLNPNSHYFSDNKKNIKNENKTKSHTILFYIAILIIFFLLYRLSFFSKSNLSNESNNKNNIQNKVSKSINNNFTKIFQIQKNIMF